MALEGRYIHYTIDISETELEEVEYTYPENLPENHPNYYLRGTTQTLTQNRVIEKKKELGKVYVVIDSFHHFIFYNEGEKKYGTNMGVKMYNNREERINNPNGYILENHHLISKIPLENKTNIYQYLYQELSKIKGYTNLKQN
tara:strand:- start:1547 stop:1975 length:429 start_codon:yes stop_codon:yes gene_type:complete